MKKTTFIDIISDLSKTSKSKIKISLKLELLNSWDSLVAIQILSELEKRTKKKISIVHLAKAKTIKDIYKLVE